MSEQPAPAPKDEDPVEMGQKGMEFADASLWLSRIFSALLPGLIGLWVDNHFGTRYFALIGVILGLISGITTLRQAAKGAFVQKKPKSPSGSRSLQDRKQP